MAAQSYHRWVALSASFYSSLIVYGNTFGFGVFFTPLLDMFGRSRSLTSVVHAILRGQIGILGVFSGLITAKLGVARTVFCGGLLMSLGYTTSFFATSVASLCFTIGVLGGTGNSLVYIGSTIGTGQAFTGTKRGFALGVQNAAVNIGGILFPLLFNLLFTMFGLKGSFLIIGGIALNAIPAAIILAYDNVQSDSTKGPGTDDTERTNTVEHLTHPVNSKCSFFGWANRANVFIILGTGASIGSVTSFMGLIVDLFIWKGGSHEQGVLCITIFNCMAIFSRVLPTLMYRFCSSSWAIGQLVLYCILNAAGIFIMANVSKPEVMLFGGGLIGLSFGAMMLSSIVFIMDNVQSAHLPVAVGVQHFWRGLVSVISGPFFGALYDWTASYRIALVVFGCIQICSSIVCMAAMIVSQESHKKYEEELDVVPTNNNAFTERDVSKDV